MYGYGYRYSAKPGLLAFNPATLDNTQFYSDPTISTSINAGSPSDTDPVSTLGDLSAAGNDGTQGTAINQPVWNTTHVTYATNDFINLDAIIGDTSTDTQGTVSGWHSPTDATPTALETLYYYGVDAIQDRIEVSINTLGQLRLIMVVSATVSFNINTDAAVTTDGVFFHWRIEQDGTASDPKIFINNVEVAHTVVDNSNPSHWYNDIASPDTCKINCRTLLSSESSFFNGDTQQIYISSDVKSADISTQIYNHNQP